MNKKGFWTGAGLQARRKGKKSTVLRPEGVREKKGKEREKDLGLFAPSL